MFTIPRPFYQHITSSGANLGTLLERLMTFYFLISENTVNQFRDEKPSVRTRFENQSKNDSYTVTRLSASVYECTIAQKNLSIIKSDLMPHLSRQTIVKDLVPAFFQCFRDPTQRQYFHQYIQASLPKVKELLVRFLIAFESGDIDLQKEKEIVDFIDLFYLFLRHEYASATLVQRLYNTSYTGSATTDLSRQAKRLLRKSKSIWLHIGLVSQEKFFSEEVIPFLKLLEASSMQAHTGGNPKEIYKNIKYLSLMFRILA